jgi:hypothetical protein
MFAFRSIFVQKKQRRRSEDRRMTSLENEDKKPKTKSLESLRCESKGQAIKHTLLLSEVQGKQGEINLSLGHEASPPIACSSSKNHLRCVRH